MSYNKSVLRVVVVTSDRYNWALRPFSYLFNIYWSSLQPVDVVGFSYPNFNLPPNFNFISVGAMDFPQDKWSDAILFYLNKIEDDHFVLMLEDYWLVRTVNHSAIESLDQYMSLYPDVLRIDLTTDRLHARGDARNAIEYGYWGSLDLIYSQYEEQYRLSLQAAIWNRHLFTQVVSPGMTPWQVEMYINPPERMKVLGTRQWPVRYANAILKGKIDKNQINLIPAEHREIVTEMIPRNWEVYVP